MSLLSLFKIAGILTLCFGSAIASATTGADGNKNEFAVVEAQLESRLAQGSLVYADRPAPDQSQFTIRLVTLKRGTVAEFQCQTVKSYLVSEGLINDQTNLNGLEIREILKPLPRPMIRLLNQRDGQGGVALNEVKFCLAEIMVPDDANAKDGNDTYTLAIPLKKRTDGVFVIADRKDIDYIVNVSGNSLNGAVEPGRLSRPSLDPDIQPAPQAQTESEK